MASKRTKLKNKEYLDNYKKEHGCSKCEEKRHWVLEFHHINPSNKLAGVSNMCNSYGIKKIQEEIDKCILVCANCHRDIHYYE